MTLDRRTLLQLMGMLGIAPAMHIPEAMADPASVKLDPATPFTENTVLEMARDLARSAYVPASDLPKSWSDLTYEQHHNIRFKHDYAIWAETRDAAEVHLRAPGSVYQTVVTIYAVEEGLQRQVRFDPEAFAYDQTVPELPVDDAVNYSGFDLRTDLNAENVLEPFVSFQGASYFKAIAKGQQYGLSARGFALKTADPDGEEFPEFRTFWLEKPKDPSTGFRLYALLDSPSVTGAYLFVTDPGNPTRMDVSATLFPRVELEHVGLAPLNSMFLYDEKNNKSFDDIRPSIHDSDGLLIHNGNGEWLWRPLNNPSTLQVSQFLDDSPRGFGLGQRSRRFGEFIDANARYDLRPSLWVEPHDSWGKGAITLVEIPTTKETNDNIVVFWRPKKPIAAGSEYQLSYSLFWCWEPPINSPLSKVGTTRIGRNPGGSRQIAIDFDKSDRLPTTPDQVRAYINGYPGKVRDPVIVSNPDTGGLQLLFRFDPGDDPAMELRAQLRTPDGKKPLTEVWLYRWTS